MAEQTTVTETSTALAADLKAKTDAAVAAVTGGGFDDPEFAASLQAAIDKDAGKEPSKPDSGTAAREAEKAAAQKAGDDAAAVAAKAKTDKTVAKTVPGDIPSALFGEKKEDKPVTDTSEADRLKFIEEQTKGMTPKAADRFKKIELRAYEAEQKAKKLEQERESEKVAIQKQIEELNLKAATKADEAELAKLRKDLEERDAIIEKAALQEHPKFKAAYDGQIAIEIEKAKKAVPSEKADEIAQLLSLPESTKRNDRITEIAEELGEIQKTKLLASLERVDRLASDKAEQLSKWKENKIHVEADVIRQREAHASNTQEMYKVAWTKGMTEISSPDKGLEVFRKVDGEDEWNAGVDARIVQVQKLLLNQNRPPEELVTIAAKAVASDDYRRMFLAQRAVVRKLAEELENLKAASPNPGDDGGDGGSGIEDSDDFVTAAIKGVIKSGAVRQ